MKIEQATVMLPYFNDIYKVGEKPKYNRQFSDFEKEDDVVKSIEEIRNGGSYERFVIITFESGSETHINANVMKLDFAN